MSDSSSYKTEVLNENPYPNESGTNDFTIKKHVKSDIYRPPTIIDQKFPFKTIANEVISKNLNTMTGQIGQAFNFYGSGSISDGLSVMGATVNQSQLEPIDGIYRGDYEENWIYDLGADYGGTEASKTAQSFKLSKRSRIYRIRVKICSNNKSGGTYPNDCLKMEIYDSASTTNANVNGYEPGTLLAESDNLITPGAIVKYYLPADDATWRFSNCDFYFNSCPMLEKDTTYYFVISRTGINDDDATYGYFFVCVVYPEDPTVYLYENGRVFYTDTNVWYEESDNDSLYFKIWVY